MAYGIAERAEARGWLVTDRGSSIALAVILVVAAYVRLHGLGDDSLWRDEASSWGEAQGSFFDILAATAGDNYPPLHNLILAASMRLFGQGEWALRISSAVFGAANVLALYWVGTIVGGRITGLIAASLLALSPFHIWYSQEARNYALLSLNATLFAGTSLWLMRKATLGRVIAAFAAAVLLLYTHPYGAFAWLCVSAAVLVVLFLRPDPEAPSPVIWVLLQLAAGLAFAPWAWLLLGRANDIHEKGFWISYPDLGYVMTQLFNVASGALVFIALMLAIAAAFVQPRPGDGDHAQAGRIGLAASPDLWVVLAWMLGPVVIGIAISLVSTPIFIGRYIIGSLPAFLLLASVGLSRFVDGWRSATAVALVVAFTITLGLAYGRPAPHEDWRRAAPYLASHVGTDGCVLVPDAGYARVLSYYLKQPLPCVIDASRLPPGGLQGNFVIVAMSGGANRKILSALSPPTWQNGDVVSFQGIIVIPFRRTGT
ncbi:MAG: glycosyltransferase family 39 protein [Bauldia sp.]